MLDCTKNNGCIMHINRTFALPLTLHYQISLPKSFTKDKKYPLFIALHGYGQNMHIMTEQVKPQLELDVIFVSLQAPFPHMIKPILNKNTIPYGFGWISSFNPQEAIDLHHQAMLYILQEMEKNYANNISIKMLMGFSQSVALNFRFIFTYPNVFDKYIALCGGIPANFKEMTAFKKTETDILYLGCKRDLIYPAPIIKRNAETIRPLCRNIKTKILDGTHKIEKVYFNEINRFIAGN